MTSDVTTEIDGAGLLAEVQRYLAAVDAFRAAGREPHWLPEPASPNEVPARRRSRQTTRPRGRSAS